MATIIETARVGVAPDALWQEIGPFAAVGRWHPLLSRVESEGPVRTPEDRDGHRQTERLLEESPRQHFYRYRMERTAIPVRDWTAELRVRENRDGSSTVVWSAEFELVENGPDALHQIRTFMRAGLDNIAHLYGQASH